MEASTHSPAPNREPLSGIVERVTYHNLDNGYAVLRVQVRGHRDLLTVIGHAATVSPGEHLQASGQWEVHREHGPQFRAAFMRACRPIPSKAEVSGVRADKGH